MLALTARAALDVLCVLCVSTRTMLAHAIGASLGIGASLVLTGGVPSRRTGAADEKRAGVIEAAAAGVRVAIRA